MLFRLSRLSHAAPEDAGFPVVCCTGTAVYCSHMSMFRKLAITVIVGTAALVLAPDAVHPQNATSTDMVEVWGEQQEDHSYRFYGRNSHFIPMYVSVSFRQLVSLAPTIDLPWRGALPPDTPQQYLFTLTPTTTRGRIGYDLTYTFAMGDPDTAAHNDDYLYLLPFAHGERWRLTQGFNGSFSHFGENQFAVDFDMPEGTPVHAARGGVVVRVKQDGRTGGPSMAYADQGNVVMIAHDDGTFGNYVHLRYRGAAVDVGDILEPGDLVGFSGNTGVSSGPHLHFDVRVPLHSGRMQSIPFYFRGMDGEAVEPRQGEFYVAIHPGGPPVDIVLGADLREADFADHRGEVPLTGNIEFRAEQFDLTWAVFMGNGFPDPIEATIGFNLVNMSADGAMPRVIRLEPREEVFVTLLRADPAGNRWQYAPTVRYRRIR